MPIVTAPKLDIDTDQRLLIVNTAPTLVNGENTITLDIQIDVYSDLKEAWVSNEATRKLRFPIRAVGGDSLPGSKELGDTYFIDSAWKIRAYEADHTWQINGNFYSEDGTSPFIKPVGTYSVFSFQQVSSLVDSTIQQLPEIEFSSFSGGVWIDTANGIAGTDYPAGTERAAVNNFADGLTIAAERGFNTFYIRGDAVIDSGLDYTDYVFIGQGENLSSFTITSVAVVLNCTFIQAQLSGTLDGDSRIEDCSIGNLDFVSGVIKRCSLTAASITLAGNQLAQFIECYSAVAGPNLTPAIDCGGSGQELVMNAYDGGIKLINKTGPEDVSINLRAGQVILDPTFAGTGTTVVRGDGKLTDNSTGGTVVNETINVQAIAVETKNTFLGTTTFP